MKKFFLIINLNENKSWGADNVHRKLLEESACQVLTPSKKIFNVLIQSGDLPTVWKRGYVQPVFSLKAKNVKYFLAFLYKFFTSAKQRF